MDFALHCFLQMLLPHFFSVRNTLQSKKRSLKNFRKLANLRVHRSNVSWQKLILIKIGIVL